MRVSFLAFAISLIVLTVLAGMKPADAGVYVVHETSPSATFCQAVVTTKDVYCPRIRLDCKKINASIKKQGKSKRAKSTLLIKSARACTSDASAIKEKDAEKLMASLYENQNLLCCTSLNAPQKK